MLSNFAVLEGSDVFLLGGSELSGCLFSLHLYEAQQHCQTWRCSSGRYRNDGVCCCTWCPQGIPLSITKCTHVLLIERSVCLYSSSVQCCVNLLKPYARLNRIVSPASILLSGLLYAHGQPGCLHCISILCTVVPGRKGRTPMNCTKEGITHSSPCLSALCSPLPCPLVVVADALVGMVSTDLLHLSLLGVSEWHDAIAS
jgi:hypothetical protein